MPKNVGEKFSGAMYWKITSFEERLRERSESEVDLESGGSSSSSEVDSPKSVAKVRKWSGKNGGHVHSQILRIREEEALLGDDAAEGMGMSAKGRFRFGNRHRPVDFVLFYQPDLPCSPLSGKSTAIETLH